MSAGCVMLCDFASDVPKPEPKACKCDACDKRYIGWKRLARHYILHPDHGSLPDEILACKLCMRLKKKSCTT